MKKRLWRGGALLLLAFALTAGSLSAHLDVRRTEPAADAQLSTPPEKIQVWFTQLPSARVSRLELTGPDGDVVLGELQVDEQERSIAAAVQESLPPGTFTVTWRTAGDDGHVQRGTFTFSVQPATR